MLIRIKVIDSSKDEWVGWFGECLIKLRLKLDKSTDIQKHLLKFIEKSLGIRRDNIIHLNRLKHNIYELELPDVAWELFLTVSQ